MSFPKRNNSHNHWDMDISPQRGWFEIDLLEIWNYRDLIKLFVWRDFVAGYKQTILGPLWYIVQPILSTVVFTIVFGDIAKLPTDGISPFLFYLSGNTIWSYFSSCLVSTSDTFINNASIFGKVYFPRLTVPISVVISNVISFGIRFGIFIIFWLIFIINGTRFQPNLWILFIPVLLLIMAGLGLGLGIIISSLTTKYRDLQKLLSFGMQLLMYTTPVIYPLSSVQGIWHKLILINPMTPVVEIFRFAFFGESSLNPNWLWYSTGFMFLVLIFGVFLFNHIEASFMDTV